MQDEIIKLEQSAVRCRRLAASIGDLSTAERLIQVAEEYETEAALLRERPNNQPDPIIRA